MQATTGREGAWFSVHYLRSYLGRRRLDLLKNTTSEYFLRTFMSNFLVVGVSSKACDGQRIYTDTTNGQYRLVNGLLDIHVEHTNA